MARSAHEIEEVIRLIPAVSAVRVAMSDAGEIEEVHVLAGSSVIPSRLSETLRRAWRHLDLRIDRRKISVARIDEGRSASERRMRLDSVDVKCAGIWSKSGSSWLGGKKCWRGGLGSGHRRPPAAFSQHGGLAGRLAGSACARPPFG